MKHHTGFGDVFEAKTTSRSFVIRTVYFMLSVILYNAWILAREEFVIYAITAYEFRYTVVEMIREEKDPPGW
ncbi:MAG: hypothetical protein JRN10_05600 [Nitrososphaerota archaeon]|nr:hypothetical protein [Nitrososphaerota archaeon]MDG6930697.1 hypothetical protein [Nitrososphaerota archaeon]